ncbi:hypothetical protein [Actinacidiphila soli]|uniref:hypothetical protein n=1 Tax=Actinacidiphila soli TaxID=2487275 RepID=UPI000FCBE6C4|nr:hypothetical protein [Actinacidiphila soli]
MTTLVQVPARQSVSSQLLKKFIVELTYSTAFPALTHDTLTLRWPNGSRAVLDIQIGNDSWYQAIVKSRIISKTGQPLVGEPFSGTFYICNGYNHDPACKTS